MSCGAQVSSLLAITINLQRSEISQTSFSKFKNYIVKEMNLYVIMLQVFSHIAKLQSLVCFK